MEAWSWWSRTQTCEEEDMEQRKRRRHEGMGEMGQKIKSSASAFDRSVTTLQEILIDRSQSLTLLFFLTDFRSK